MLLLTGTHGTETGVSGLINIDQLEHLFYAEDCQMVGVKAGPRRNIDRLPLSTRDWNKLPSITEPAQKMEPPPPGSFYDDPELKGMDFRLANMTYFYGHTQKLINDINEVKF